MPLANLIKKINNNGKNTTTSHSCVLLRVNNSWSILDPETNNELVKGASTNFIREEISAGRLVVDLGWDQFTDNPS